MAFFGKKDNNNDNASKAEPGKVDPRKAHAWFERAKTVTDSRQYDFAIECYISGLKFDPRSLQHHEALREVALRRKVGGGKPVGMLEAMKRGSAKTDLEKMLNAEFLWSKDPFNPVHARDTMEYAAACGFEEVTYWVGGLVMDANRAAKKPDKKIYLEIRDLFAQVGAFDRAVDACRLAVTLDQKDIKLLKELHDLEAERTLSTGKYDDGSSFQDSVLDMDKQKALIDDEEIARTGDTHDEVIKRAEAECKENPADVELMQKYVRVLLAKEEEETENVASEVLAEAYDNFGQYRFKMQIGEIRIKQYNRRMRELKNKLNDDPNNEAIKKKMQNVAAEQVRFELKEFEERVKNYPTDLSMRFNLGRRQLAVNDYDSSIASFQEARSDPKYRAVSLRYLGEAFAAKGWFDESIDTFREGIKAYQFDDDQLALAMRYHLMNALEHKARNEKKLEIGEEAAKIASQIAQVNFNYLDIRDRLEKLRSLVEELRSE